MQNAGIVGAEREAADRQALELSGKYLNVGRVEAMEAYRTVRSVAGRPDEVPGLMPTVIGALSSMKSLGLERYPSGLNRLGGFPNRLSSD
jgi:hypothetical protein